MSTDEVPANAGERCGCGKPAVLAFLTERWGRVPWCGIFDDADYIVAAATEPDDDLAELEDLAELHDEMPEPDDERY